MGEAAEMMLDGTLCAGCGEFMGGEGDGFPRYCAGCRPEEAQSPRPGTGKGKARRRKRQRIRRSQRRRYALETAETTGWTQLSDFHFRKVVDGKRVDWWPSTGRYSIDGKMVDAEAAQSLLKKEASPCGS